MLGWLERKKKEGKKEKRKMTKLDFHHFQVLHFNNVFELSWCHCRVGATPARRSNCLQTRRIHHQVKYRRLNANTCIVAAILFSGHPYIGRHCRATLYLSMAKFTVCCQSIYVCQLANISPRHQHLWCYLSCIALESITLQIQEVMWSGTGNLVLTSCMVLEKQ